MALALARELPVRYLALQDLIGPALFEHYEPYADTSDDGDFAEDPRELRIQIGRQDAGWIRIVGRRRRWRGLLSRDGLRGDAHSQGNDSKRSQ